MTPTEIQHKIDGLKAKLRWPNLPKHLADKYKAEIEKLLQKLHPDN